jgi:hypothetical protein
MMSAARPLLHPKRKLKLRGLVDRELSWLGTRKNPAGVWVSILHYLVRNKRLRTWGGLLGVHTSSLTLGKLRSKRQFRKLKMILRIIPFSL